MSDAKKYVNVAFNAYGLPTTFICEIDEVKKGDFVIVPTLSGDNIGRVMSVTSKKVFTISLARTRKIKRLATPKEINEVADLFGVAKNPEFADDEEEFSFFTNGGYGQRELNKVLKQLEKKQQAREEAKAENKDSGTEDISKKQATEEASVKSEKLKPSANPTGLFKSADEVPDYWRYVAIGILAFYFLRDYILD